MRKVVISIVLVSLCSVFVGAESLPTVALKPGTNEVVVRVHNKSSVNLESIRLVVNEDDLPDGFSVSESSQFLDIPARRRSEGGLLFCIDVAENVGEGVYQIPFVLKDKADHAWNFTLEANLIKALPDKFDLLQNYPNPFNATTKISYSLVSENKQRTRLVIYDALGRHVRTLVDKEQTAGSYAVIWDGKNDSEQPVTTGIYFCRITSGSSVKTRKMLLIE